MPTRSYHDDKIERLLDPEYSSLYIQVSLEESLKDGDIEVFQMALSNVLEAAEKREAAVPEIYRSRQQVYRRLLGIEDLTLEAAEAALKMVGIVPEREPAEV